MKSFLDFSPSPSSSTTTSARVTFAARVRDAMASGDWFTRHEIAERVGLSDAVVNTQLHAGIARRTIEREHAGMIKRTRGVMQRYRLAPTGGTR